MLDEKEIGESSSGSSDKDELYQAALDIIRSEGKASTSFLQRKLQIGYNRAARIIDMMEADGIVSKANHVGKRDVLIMFRVLIIFFILNFYNPVFSSTKKR